MSSIDLPQQEDNKESPKDREGMREAVEEKAREAAKILFDEGLLKGVDESLFEEAEVEDIVGPEVIENLSKEEKGEESKIEEETKKTKEKPKRPDRSKVEELLNEVEEFDPKTVAKLIETGASNRDIISLLRERPEKFNEFYKFNGSSYYLSQESFEEESNPKKYKWRTRSLKDKTYDADVQEYMFSKYIPNELSKYRELLKAFGGAEEMFAAIDSLDESEIIKSTRILKPRLLELARTGEYKKEKESKELSGKEGESGEQGEKKAVEKSEKKQERKESKESLPLFEVGDLVMRFDPSAPDTNYWQKPKKVERVKIDEEGMLLKVEGEDAYFLVKTKSGDTQFRVVEKAEGKDREKTEDSSESVANVEKTIPQSSSEDLKRKEIKENDIEEPGEVSKSEKENSQESQDESIDNEVKEKFREQFNISEPDLRSIPGFVALSGGQQKLVYKNFSKVTLGRIEEQGLKEHRKDMANSGRFSRAWKGFFGTYYKKKEQSLAGKEILSRGIDLHRGALSDIVKQTRLSGLDLNESGSLKFISHQEFTQIADKNIPEEVELMSQLNMAAEEFSQVSDEWRYADTLSKAKDSIKKLFGGEVDDYREKLENYKKALSNNIDYFAKEYGQERVRKLMEIDKKVRFTQFFESGNDIDYEEAMQNIKDEPKWWRLADNVGVEKGAYMALGSVGRYVSYSMLTVAAVPAAVATAIGVGGYRARSQALEQLHEEARLRRGGADAGMSRSPKRFMDRETLGKLENRKIKGVLKERKEEQDKREVDVINTVSSESLNEKLQLQLEKINSPSASEEERNNALESLRRRVRYTRIKMEGGEYQEGSEDGEMDGKMHEFSGGLIDYGDAYHRTGHRYELLSTLGEAEATLAVNDPDIRGDIDARLDRYLNYKNDKVKSYVHKKTWRGAVLAGGFASLGAWLFGGWGASDEAGQGAESVSPNVGSEEAGDATLGGKADAAETSVASETPPPPPNYEAEVLGSQDFVINEKGEGMIHAIADGLEDKFEMSHEKAMDIGNKLYLKGEGAGAIADDEMYNLVGEGAAFKLDFGDLTADDLDNLSTDDLVDKIDFDNETGFKAGESGIKGLELPEQEADTAGYDSAVDQSGRYEDAPIESRDLEGTTFQDLREEAEAAQEQARQEAEAAEAKRQAAAESGGANAAVEEATAETSTENVPADTESESSPAETSSATESLDEAGVDALREDVLDRDVTRRINVNIDTLLGQKIPPGATGVYDGISINALNELNDYMDTNSGHDVVTTIEKLAKDNPRLLLTLDKVVNTEEFSSGTVLDRLSDFISNTITENQAQIDKALSQQADELGALTDAFANAEVSEEANKELVGQMRGFNEEVTQQAQKTGRMKKFSNGVKKLEEVTKDVERFSRQVDYEDGTEALDKGGDALRTVSNLLKRFTS